MDEKYPVGTRVVLEDGKIGTVTGYSLNLKTESGDVKVDLDKATGLTIIDEMSMLPDELQLEIGKYLRLEDIISLSTVSKRARHLSKVMYNRKIHGWKPKNRKELDKAIYYFSRKYTFVSEAMIKFGLSTYGHPNTWNVSEIKDMSKLFAQMDFNYNISDWDTSGVTNMSMMFYHNIFFNQKIGKWDVSRVTNASQMFRYTNFNQNISNWNVRNIIDMSGMFYGKYEDPQRIISGWIYHPNVNKNNMVSHSEILPNQWEMEDITIIHEERGLSYILVSSDPGYKKLFNKLPYDKKKLITEIKYWGI